MKKYLHSWVAGRLDFKSEIAFILIFGLGIFYYLALFSFEISDPTIFSSSIPKVTTIQNLGGRFGATLSSYSVFCFGLSALFLPIPMLEFFRKSKSMKLNSLRFMLLFGLLAMFLSGVLLVSLFKDFFTIFDFTFPSGGKLGAFLKNLTIYHLGISGAYLSAFAVLAIGFLCVRQRFLLFTIEPFLAGKNHSESSSTSQFSFVSNFFAKFRFSLPATSVPAGFSQPNFLPHPPNFTSVDPVFEAETPEFVESSTEIFAEPSSFYKNKTTYKFPDFGILSKSDPSKSFLLSTKDYEIIANLLTKTFQEFQISGKIIGYQSGPVVTVYEFQPDAGIKQSKVFSLIDDLALALKVDSILIHPIPGKRALGVQVPNPKRDTVLLGDIITSDVFKNAASPLTFAMGKSLNGQPVCADITTMPHLLCAGATGSGKSVAVNALISSIILKSSPDDVRMILVDPKMLELSVYEGIPHLLMPVITEPDRASTALKWAASEMERRYKLMQHASVRHISSFNQFWEKASEDKKQSLRTLCNDQEIDKLPFILIVIDELADLMMTAPKDVESSIQRLAQKARASGIHMVLATQRPSVDIITGVIKANLPCRISFQVVSKHDSRTILDQMGSEKLLGKGDLLFQKPGTGKLERIQGAFVSDEEVIELVAAAKLSGSSQYDSNIMNWIDDEVSKEKKSDEDDSDSSVIDDPKYSEAIQIAKNYQVVSASFLQRHLKIGYNRAARMVEFMESKGLVAKSDGSKPRKWLGGGSSG